MKKLIILSVLLLSVMGSSAQCDLPYKPLSAFGTDTTAFIIYNFVDRADCYKGKTYQTLVQDLQIPIDKGFLYPVMYKMGKTNGLALYMIQDFQVRGENKRDSHMMIIKFDQILDQKEVSEKMGIKSIKANSNQLQSYFKDMKITEIILSISEYSPHYPKYKDKLK